MLEKMLTELTEVMKIRYSRNRIKWLILTSVTVSMVYLSSSEIWQLMDGNSNPEISIQTLMVFSIVFLIFTFFVHLFDVNQITSNIFIAIITSILSLIIDITFISFFEFIVLSSIQVSPKTISQTIGTLLVGSVPSSLGVVSISSLTSNILEKKVENLVEAMNKLEKKMREMDELAEKRKEQFEKFEETRRKFKEEMEE